MNRVDVSKIDKEKIMGKEPDEHLIKRMQDWYLQMCDGDWEHSYGVEIKTLDNPGWNVEIDLTGTLFEDLNRSPQPRGLAPHRV